MTKPGAENPTPAEVSGAVAGQVPARSIAEQTAAEWERALAHTDSIEEASRRYELFRRAGRSAREAFPLVSGDALKTVVTVQES
jgi:hypothetical protein